MDIDGYGQSLSKLRHSTEYIFDNSLNLIQKQVDFIYWYTESSASDNSHASNEHTKNGVK